MKNAPVGIPTIAMTISGPMAAMKRPVYTPNATNVTTEAPNSDFQSGGELFESIP
jgi:hypothetical protein